MASIADMLIGGYNQGRALRQDREAEQNKSRLAGLLQQAYNAPTPERGGFISEAIGIDPQAALTMDANLQKGDTAKAERLYGMSAALMQAPEEMRPQMYAHMVPELQRLGIPAPTEYSPEVVSTARQVLQAFGGDEAAEQYTLSPGAARYDASGNLIAERPFAPQAERWDLVNVPDGNGGSVQMERNPATGAMRQPSYGQAPQQEGPPLTPPTIGGGDMFAFLGDAGATITSGQRTPERNLEVGGVPNSFHLTGQARDILPPQTQQQAQMIRQEAAARGLEIIDEGDHWHLEPRGNAPRAGAQRGRLGYTPPKQQENVPSGYRARPDGSLEPIPGGPADKPPTQPKPKRMGAEAANKVGLYDNAIRSAQEWFNIVAEKDANGNYTGGYNNAAAMGPAARSAFLNALRAKLRAESGAAISEAEIDGEAERYASRFFGGDHVDLQNATRLLKDLVQQRNVLVGDAARGGAQGQYRVGQVIEKGGKQYRVVGGDMDDPEVEEVI